MAVTSKCDVCFFLVLLPHTRRANNDNNKKVEKKDSGFVENNADEKALEKYGLTSRHQYPTIPPKVEYDLTEKGRDLANVLNALEIWVDKWFPYVPEKTS